MLALAAAAVILAAGAAAAGQLAVAAARAGSVADAAALAGASALAVPVAGASEDPCARAGRAAAEGGGRLEECRVSIGGAPGPVASPDSGQLTGTVDVTVSIDPRGPAWLAGLVGPPTAQARAGAAGP
ncbi:hypothetical protein [Quadrisphaera granulorum]|uniref:hypothetical protein n=1 Tax=Quadrisphaera granulorum TaxID=317664 RepID=UPI0011B671C0|nr:hypothetical protein [Quadrisphaera granulorum]